MSALSAYVWSTVTSFFSAKPQTNAEKLQQRFRNDPQVDEVYKKYFSCYANNLLPLDDAVLTEIGRIAERRAVGTAVGKEWHRIILGNGGIALDSTHRYIPHEPHLVQALNAQFIFERELIRLETLDKYLALRHGKGAAELALLKRAITPPAHFWSAAEKFSKAEQDFLDELGHKAAHYGRTLKQQIQESIRMRERFLEEIDARMAAIRAARFTPEEAVWLDPKSPQMREIIDGAKRVEPSAVFDPPDLHPSLRDHCVVLLGDPIKDPNTEFVIVKRPERMPDEAWLAFISSEHTFELCRQVLQSPKGPNEEFPIQFEHDRETYTVQVCREKASETLGLHVNGDFWKKTRRKVVAPGKFERTNKPDEVGIVKNLCRKLVNKDWSVHREATAGPDSHEAIAVNRFVLVRILSGRFGDIPQSVAQNLGEYFYALPVADIADLTGSYKDDKRFSQAERLQDYIYGQAVRLYRARMIVPYLEKGISGQFEWKKHSPRFDQLVSNVFEVYGPWCQALEQFLQELNLPINRKIKAVFGDEFVAELGGFLVDLQTFMRDAPHPDIRPVIAARKAIMSRGPMNAAAMRDLDLEWTNWKRGRSPEDIDRLLSETCARIDRGLEALAPRLINVSVPFSSTQMQGEIAEAIKSNPTLVRLYPNAIPPIWQNKARLGLVRKELMEGTELSPTWMHEGDMLQRGESRLLASEFDRSRRAKVYIGARNKA